MGAFSWLIGKLIYPFLFVSGSTYWAFKLGQNLPIASRKAGRFVGMQYNYLKVTLRFFSPDTKQANEIVSEFRKGS